MTVPAMIRSECLAEMLPDIRANLLRAEPSHRLIRYYIDLTVMAELGEVANDSKDAKIASGPSKRLGDEPVDR